MTHGANGGAEAPAETALVQISPDAAVIFGRIPEGVNLEPLDLVPEYERQRFEHVVGQTAALGNLGAQAADGATRAQGLVRLAPETLEALRAGARTVPSRGYNIGALVGRDGKFVAQVRWLPVTGAHATTIAASAGVAVALLVIQAQLNRIERLLREGVELTSALLQTVRESDWATLHGLDVVVRRTIRESTRTGSVTSHAWANLQGREADIQAQRQLYSRRVKKHIRKLKRRDKHVERREYLDHHAEAILLDAHCLLVAESTCFAIKRCEPTTFTSPARTTRTSHWSRRSNRQHRPNTKDRSAKSRK